jgi:serine/threonine protein kinase
MTTPITSNSAPSLQLLSESELVRTVLSEDYDILEELGRGGMAIVFRAREKALDREVAIKVLPARLAVDKEFVERFEHEARTSAKLEHPNIVPIYRVGRAGPNGEVIYFVMKLLRGQSLSAVLRGRGKLGAEDVRRILTETASALGYAARRSVVHRDIKPDNIMLDSEGRCVITDFGIAKAPGGQQTAAGTSLGTPRYMSPEHAGGSPLDGRSDMYSLGVVAYQCLIGKTPFDAEDPFAVLYKHINEPVPQPTLTSDDERQLYSVIARMLAKKPDDRFQTGNELVEALGGQVSNPTLVPAVRTSVGLMAPTEMIPTPQPWYTPWWNKRSRLEQRAVLGVVIVTTLVMTVVATNLVRGFGATSPIVPTTASAQVALPNAPLVTPQAASLDSIKKADSVKTLAAKTPAKSAASTRVAAILAYNKLKSSCPKQRDTSATAKPIPYSVRADSIRDRALSDSMPVGYDVCGLPSGSVFTTTFTLTKLNQHGLGKQPPHSENAPGLAQNPRYHQRWPLDLKGLSSGDYELAVVVTDGKKRQASASRKFRMLDRQP